jgi:hypothetical protein
MIIRRMNERHRNVERRDLRRAITEDALTRRATTSVVDHAEIANGHWPHQTPRGMRRDRMTICTAWLLR